MAMLNRYLGSAAGLFLLGLVLVALSVLRGEGRAGIALFIPFFFGTGLLASLGVLFFFLGMVLLFIGMAQGAASTSPGAAAAQGALDEEAGSPGGTGEKRTRTGAVILIGPIPLVFGSDPGIARGMFILALALMALFIAILLLLALF